MFWVGETCSLSFSKTPNSQLRKFCRNVFWSGKRNVLWVRETCSHSEHVFPKLLTPNSENFGETCSESEKRALSRRNEFSLRTRFSKTPNSQLRKFWRNVFWVGETCCESEKRALSSHSEHVFPKLLTPNSENFVETCSESGKRVLSRRNVLSLSFSKTPNSQLRKFWETCSESEKRVLTQNTFFQNS